MSSVQNRGSLRFQGRRGVVFFFSYFPRCLQARIYVCIRNEKSTVIIEESNKPSRSYRKSKSMLLYDVRLTVVFGLLGSQFNKLMAK